MNTPLIYAFIKAIHNDYFDSFINNGEICLNTSKFLRDYESLHNDNNIGDKYEGEEISCGYGFEVKVSKYDENDPVNLEREWLTLGIGESLTLHNEVDNPNILCLYALTFSNKNKSQHVIPKKFVDEFSNHRFVIINNPKIFVNKISKELNNKGIFPVYGGCVKYCKSDNEMKTNLTHFHKRDSYLYQNEYRILCYGKKPEQLIIKIGSMAQIAQEVDLSQNKNIWTLEN